MSVAAILPPAECAGAGRSNIIVVVKHTLAYSCGAMYNLGIRTQE